jgi:hypothetical protein
LRLVKLLPGLVSLLWLACAAALAPASLRAADSLHWDAERDLVDAEIEAWTVPQVLQRVVTATGWKVFIDPAVKDTFPTKFRQRSSGDALQRLLGSLNFALAPDTSGPPRLFVYRTSRADATRAINAAETTATSTNKNRIENELIVTLKPGEKIEDIAKRLGAKVVGRIDGMNAYRLRFDDAKSTESARSDLANDPAVAGVEDNFSIPRPETAQSVAGPARPLGLVPKAVPEGQHVIVGLIDTAVQGKEGGIDEFLLPSISVAEECARAAGGPSHGTSMAETVLRGVAGSSTSASTAVRILPVDIYGCNPTTSTFDIAMGVYKAVNGGARIVNISSGGPGDSPFLANTIASAAAQGVKFYAAAGNEPTTAPTYPAAYPNVTAVTAGDRQGNIAPYANRGSFVDVIAPGTSVINFNGQQFVVTGTSASTAYASGNGAAAVESGKKTTPTK